MRYSIQRLKQIPIATRIIVSLIFGFTLYSRLAYLSVHRTDKDDIGVAITIFNQYDSFKATNFGNPQHKRYHTALYQFLRRADGIGILKPIIQTFVVSWAWTYAPLQYVGMDWLLDKNMSYREVLFWGRLPTAIFGILNVALMASLLIILYQKQLIHHILIVVGTLLLALSHEHIIFSQVMLNYELGITAHILFLLFLINDTPQSDKLKYIVYGLVFLTPFMQYQAVFVAIAWAGAILLTEKPTFLSYNFINRYAYLSLPFIAFGILYVAFLRNLHDVGLWTWKNGSLNQYWFDHQQAFVFPKGIIYMLQFFIQNSYDVYTAMLSCVNENSVLFYVQNVFFVGLGVMGIGVLIKSHQKITQKIAVHSALLIVVWIAMIVLQKFTLSPTRHNLILLPVFIIWIVLGINALQKFMIEKWYAKIAWAMAILLFAGFTVNYSEFLKERKDKFDENQMKTLMENYQVNHVVCYGESNLGELLTSLQSFQDVVFTTTYRHVIDYYNVHAGMRCKKAPAPTANFIAYSHHLPLKYQETDSLHRLYFPKVPCVNKQSSIYMNIPDLKDIFDSLSSAYTYHIYPLQEKYSYAELEFSTKTKYGTNGHFLYFVEVKPVVYQ